MILGLRKFHHVVLAKTVLHHRLTDFSLNYGPGFHIEELLENGLLTGVVSQVDALLATGLLQGLPHLLAQALPALAI